MFDFFKKTKKSKATSRHSNDENITIFSFKTLNREDGERIEQQFTEQTGKKYRYVDTLVKHDGTRLHRLVLPYRSIKEASIMCDDGRILSDNECEQFIHV